MHSNSSTYFCFSTVWYIILITILFLGSSFFTSCAPKQDTYSHYHERMLAILDSIVTDARQNPLPYFHANAFRVAYVDSLQQANPNVPMLQYNYALELQNSRDIELSIPVLQRLGQFTFDRQSQRMINEALAISYLRMAELSNCIQNYTPQNCILPFAEEAIHADTSYIRMAIRTLERLLTDHPDNYTWRWMYNISHVANGTYPDSVPADWLIPGLDQVEELPQNFAYPVFTDVAMEAGVADNRISGSSCAEDFNGNGLTDIFATSYGLDENVVFYTMNETTGNNTSRPHFTDRTTEAGLDGIMGGLNLVCADFFNNGHTDVLVLRGAWLSEQGEHPNSLLRNNGNGTFTDITIPAGLLEFGPTQVAAVADITLNGYLDIFIGYESASPWAGVFSGDDTAKRYPSALFLNQGDGTFSRFESLNGFTADVFVKGAAWADINNNGFPDLFISVMGGDNLLFAHRGLDENGLPIFEELAKSAGVQQPQFSFPAGFLDVNNNGLQDLLVVTYDVRYINRVAEDVSRERLGKEPVSEFSRLFLNNGDETFTDATDQFGLNKVTFGMGANIADLTNNGFPDIYIGNGAPDLTSIIPNRLFLNEAGIAFHEATALSRTGHLQKGHGVSMADFNQDGLIDIYTVLGGAVESDFYHNALFINESAPSPFLIAELRGSGANRQGIGARIQAVASLYSENGEQLSSRSIYRTISGGASFGQNNLSAHFGLHPSGFGAEFSDARDLTTAIDSLIISWPDPEAPIQIITNPDLNQRFVIEQP